MNQSQINELIALITSTIKEGKDFAIEQAPLFVQEYLSWLFWESFIWITVWTILPAIVLFIVWRSTSLVDDRYNYPRSIENSEKRFLRFMTLITSILVFFLAVAINVPTMVKVKIAPRVVLIDAVLNR